MIDDSRKDKRRIRARLGHHGTCLGAMFLAVSVSAAAPFTAWTDPELIYTGEKWTSLRDNVLEYDELTDLIHEHSMTVINNRIEYDEYRGRDHDDIKNVYQNMANRLYDSSDKMMDATDEDQPRYGSIAAGTIGVRFQAEQNQSMADSQNEDDYVRKLEHDRQKASLVKGAQVKMNSYWQKFKTIPALEEAAATALSQYQSTAVETGQGMVTQAGLLSTQEKVEAAQATIQTDEKKMGALRRGLCVMTGRSYDTRPGIQEIVIPDSGEVDSIDLTADKERAKTINYTRAANERRLKYTGVGNQHDVMKRRVEDGRRQIEADMEAKYKLSKQAQADYDQAREELELAVRNAQAAEHRYSLGIISRNEYLQQRDGLISRRSSNDVAGLRFGQAMEDYRWAVNGLAQTKGA